jgi:hypothetical protein
MAADTPIISTGSSDFSQGVDSLKTPTQAGPDNVNGLTASQLAWLINATVRDGSISPRDGWVYRGVTVGLGSLPYLLGSIFQGKTTYVPSLGNPYEIWVVGGHVLKVDPTGALPPIDLSVVYDLQFPASLADKCYFVQANSYLVIQAGDYNPQTGNGTLPLFWNGSVLTQSNGITGITQIGAPIPNTYTIAATSAWTVPAVAVFPFGRTGAPTDQPYVTIHLAAPYTGNPGDKITIYSAPTASGNFAPSTLIGNFVVISIGTNTVTVQLISPNTYVGTVATVADGPFIFTLEVAVLPGPTQTVNVLNTLPVETITAHYPSIGVPPKGTANTIDFANNYLYPGSVGDIIAIYGDGNQTPFGTFQVTGISAGQILATSVAPQNIGTNMGGQCVILIVSSFLIPPIGQTINVPLDNQYIGSLGDVISVPDVGTFTVTNIGTFPEGRRLLLRTIGATGVGTVFPVQFTLTVEQAPSSTGLLINQIPAATAMAYYVGRIFYAQGKVINYGDVTGSLSGTAENNYLDAVLSVTQNPFILGGGGFAMPSGNDNITGLAIPQMINAALGQGLLNIGTANGVFALQVPQDQTQWDSLTASNPPQIFVVQQSNGFANDWCVSSVNGDLWFQSYLADIRSLLTAVRYFQQWGNVSLSSNEQRILELVNTNLLFFASSIYFNNRLLNTTYPQETPYGVVHPALIPLDLTTISTLEQQDSPNWEGQNEGLQIFQMTTATYGNLLRAFMTVLSTQNPGQMESWEIVPGQIGDVGPTGPSRIEWQFSTCSFTFGELFKLKELLAGEIWIDEIEGVVDFEIEYCPDGSSCFYPWSAFSVCTQTVNNTTYPPTILSPGTRKPLVLPKPPQACAGENSRPSNIAYEFQLRVTVRGQCRFRGVKLHAQMVRRPLYEGLIKTIGSWAKSIFTSLIGG